MSAAQTVGASGVITAYQSPVSLYGSIAAPFYDVDLTETLDWSPSILLFLGQVSVSGK